MRFKAVREWCVGRAVIVALVVLSVAVPAVCAAKEYVILVDCTGTMRYQGRGDATMQALGDLVQAMSPGDFVTIYGYGEEPFAALPEYPWHIEAGDPWSAMRGSITLPFNADRTDITRGLELVWSERELVLPSAFARPAGPARGASYVLLLTDGKLIPCYDDYSKYDKIYAQSRSRLLKLAKQFGDAGVPIYTVGLGPDQKIDGALLTAVSSSSGGEYLHSATSGDLAGVFGTVVAAIVDAPATAGAEREVSQDDNSQVALASPGGNPQVASAGTGEATQVASSGSEAASPVSEDFRAKPRTHAETSRTPAELGARAAELAFRDVASTVRETVLGVLGVIVGFVAIGVQRKQSWTHAFTKPLLQKEIRVKGYFRPTYADGIVGARCCIPIENPGLPSVEVGEGTEFGADLNGVLVEVFGTTDGSPPTLKVLKGEVNVNGEVVEEEQKLEDGDIVEFNGKPYTYLRGSRR